MNSVQAATSSLPIGAAGVVDMGQIFQQAMRCKEASKHTEAFRFFKIAAVQGYAEAQYQLGMCYMEGEGVDKDEAQGRNWIEKASQNGSVNAASHLSNLRSDMNAKLLEGFRLYQASNFTEAFRIFKEVADQGFHGGQCLVGVCYLSGEGVPVDLGEAEKWLKLSQSQGNVSAEGILKMMKSQPGTPIVISVVDGQIVGIPKSVYDEAQLLRKDINQITDTRELFNLGHTYKKKKHYQQAIQCFKKSSDLGCSDASYALRNMYWSGDEGLPQDTQLGNKYQDKARKQERGEKSQGNQSSSSCCVIS